MLPDLHTGFSRARSGGLAFPILSEFSTVYSDPHKGFGIVNEAEVNVFLASPCFSYDPIDVCNLISGSSAFSKSSLYIWKLSLHVLLKPSLTILSITLLACKMIPTVWQLEYSLELPFFGIGIKIDLFHSCMYCWIFQVCWHINIVGISFRAYNFILTIMMKATMQLKSYSVTKYNFHSEIFLKRWML